jgi:hypothetical protein
METQTIETNSTFKIIALLNKRIETGKAMNALAHCMAGAVNHMGEEGRTALKFLNFVDAGGQTYPSISARSFVILRGTESDIRKARQRSIEAGISAVCFSESMTGETYREQLQRTSETPSEAMSFFALVLAGPAELLNPITKKYSLWRDNPLPPPGQVAATIDEADRVAGA